MTNLDKVLYPSGFTKAQVVDYHARISPWMMPHLTGRCITFHRYPDGVDRRRVLREAVPEAPARLDDVAVGPGDRDGEIAYCRIEEPAPWCGRRTSLRWSCTARWRGLPISRRRWRWCSTSIRAPAIDRGVLPGGAGRSRGARSVGALEGWSKTSGSKGLQLYVPLNTPADPPGGGGLRAGGRAAAGTSAPRPRHDDDGEGGPARQDVRRLEPERTAQDDDRGLLDAGGHVRPSHAGDLGGSGSGARRRRSSCDSRSATCSSASRPRRSLRPGPHPRATPPRRVLTLTREEPRRPVRAETHRGVGD